MSDLLFQYHLRGYGLISTILYRHDDLRERMDSAISVLPDRVAAFLQVLTFIRNYATLETFYNLAKTLIGC
jgi:hypothetical protein